MFLLRSHLNILENWIWIEVVEIESLEIENEEADEQEGNAPKVDEGGKTVSGMLYDKIEFNSCRIYTIIKY